MAAAILEGLGRVTEVEVRSAGTAAAEGERAAEPAERVAARHGLSLADHRSTPLTLPLLEWADHVLTMEARHGQLVERMGAGEKVTLLSEYGGDGRDIPDPLGQGEEAYAAVFEALERYLANFLETEERPK